MRITKGQIKILHTLLSNHKLMGHKRELIASYTDQRTTSSREMNQHEAKEMIDRLSENDPFQKMRKMVFSLARQMGMIWGNTQEDHKMNAAKIDLFLKSRGTVKRPLNKLKYHELCKVVTQFRAMGQNREKQGFNKELKAILTEIGIKA